MSPLFYVPDQLFSKAPGDVGVSAIESASVRVHWQAVPGADAYIVTLSQAAGDEQLGLCRQSSHAVSLNTSSLSVTVGEGSGHTLRPYTTYSVTVTAESHVLGKSEEQSKLFFTTMQAGKVFDSM